MAKKFNFTKIHFVLPQNSSEDMNISSDNEDLLVDDDDDDVHMDIVVDPVDADHDAGKNIY